MNIKQKFETIDQSQLSENQKGILDKIKVVTKDFTIEDQKSIEKVDGALDNIIAKLKSTNPSAIKETKKAEPKVVVEKEKKSRTKTTKTTPKSKEPKKPITGKRTIMSVAKEIRKENESWKDAMSRAKKTMQDEKEMATKKIKTETEKLLAFIKRRKELDGLTGTTISKDLGLKAKPKGQRVVTNEGNTTNQYGTFSNKLGRKYYESRDNRSDRLSPDFKDRVYLAEGGFVSKGQIVWNKLNSSERIDFLYKYFTPEITPRSQEILVGKTYKFLPRKVKMKIESIYANVEDYADGGSIIGIAETPLARDLGIDYTGLVGETGAMSSGEMFADGGNIGRYEVVKVIGFDEKGKTLPQNKIKVIADFPTKKEAVNFVYEQQFKRDITQRDIFIRDTKNNKNFAQGGSLVDGYLTDPNFGDFQNTMFMDGGATGLPEGTQQSFVNYYLGEGASVGIFANGGGMDSKLEAGVYRVGKPIKISTNFYEQKIVEVFVNGEMATASDYARSLSDFKSMKYPIISKEQLESMYMYGGNFFKKGGRLLTTRERYIVELKGLSGLKQEALEDFIAEYDLTDSEILNIVIGLGRKQIEVADVVTAVVGKKNNAETKRLLRFAKSDKALRSYAKGGDVKRNLSRDQKFVNYSQDHEVRYSKDKSKRAVYTKPKMSRSQFEEESFDLFEDGGNMPSLKTEKHKND